jgi:hypothetical protein
VLLKSTIEDLSIIAQFDIASSTKESAMLGARGSTSPVASCSYSNTSYVSLSGVMKNRASLSKKSYLAPSGLPSQNGEFPCSLYIF